MELSPCLSGRSEGSRNANRAVILENKESNFIQIILNLVLLILFLSVKHCERRRTGGQKGVSVKPDNADMKPDR